MRILANRHGAAVLLVLMLALGPLLPVLGLAQVASPLVTAATSLQTNIRAWLTPVAVILVMVLGAMTMAHWISWDWCVAAILGIAISFGRRRTSSSKVTHRSKPHETE